LLDWKYQCTYKKIIQLFYVQTEIVVHWLTQLVHFHSFKNLMAFQGKLNGRVTLHESRNDLQLVNLCVPTRSAIVVSRLIVMLLDTTWSFWNNENIYHVQLHSTALIDIRICFCFILSHFYRHTFLIKKKTELF